LSFIGSLEHNFSYHTTFIPHKYAHLLLSILQLTLAREYESTGLLHQT